MKRNIFLALAAAALLSVGCGQFPTSYERIEPEKARLLDFIYEPAEAAPGDTVLLKAIFAGRTVTADELNWRMSPRLIVNDYGVTTVLDTVPLERIPEACTFSDRTSCIAFKFKIPENIIAESPMAPEKLVDALPDYFRPYLPQEFLSMTKTMLLTLVDQLSSLSDISALPVDSTAMSMLPVLLQCYTIPIRIYCTIKNDHTIVSGYNIRYNSRCTSIPGLDIPVNHNPSVDSIGIYIVHAAPLTTFNPADGRHEFTYLSLSDTCSTELTIDEGYTYFVATSTGNVDSTLSIDASIGNGGKLPEQHTTLWYIEFDKEENDGVSPYKLPAISGDDFTGGRHLAQLYPSGDTEITTCTAWLEVSDMFLNEYFRPQGSMLKEIRLRFAYTEEYRKSLK